MNLKRQKTDYINILFAAFAIAFSVLFILAYNMANDKAIALLLSPHAMFTELFYNINLTYVENVGYIGLGTAFIIAKDCFGVYFVAMLFCMFVCGFVKQFSSVKKLYWCGFSFVLAVVVGVLVSCMRIIGSIPFVSSEKFSTLHTGIGAVLYLLTLISSYAILRNILRRQKT